MTEVKPEGSHYPVVSSQPLQSSTAVNAQGQGQPPCGNWVRDWDTGLFHCGDDIPICLCGIFCGLCLTCKVSQDMDESALVACCVPLPVAFLRTKYRTHQNIPGSILKDCLLSSFCGPCTLCQLARDVNTTKLTCSY
ncbi:hypothetical protein EGW08_007507 [Elysia chlorotica]|uniref:PLAC8-like protein 1 n=1 Tax=Elysia chlorotica TaxID=188477 RepID=A0A433TT52_ELYCH|nr:hypothetical protein EGW08_007507 [Elysia chlorotica]